SHQVADIFQRLADKAWIYRSAGSGRGCLERILQSNDVCCHGSNRLAANLGSKILPCGCRRNRLAARESYRAGRTDIDSAVRFAEKQSLGQTLGAIKEHVVEDRVLVKQTAAK